MLLLLSLALAAEPATTAPATAPADTTAAPAATTEAATTPPAATDPVATATTTAPAACATVTTNADGTTTLSDPALPPCGPDGKPVEQAKKKKLSKSNNGRMEAEETRE